MLALLTAAVTALGSAQQQPIPPSGGTSSGTSDGTSGGTSDRTSGGTDAAPPNATPNATTSTTPTATAGAGDVKRTVTVEAAGGPADLTDAVTAAVKAWRDAAPGLVSLELAPGSASTIRYVAPALLGPDTLSLDTRVPGKDGVTVEVATAAVTSHPMVLLHEVGVLVGLPEGGQGVMAFAVPASAEPDTPTAADAAALKALRTFAPEDLNRDGTVDFYDLVLFGQAFGTQGVNLPADFNGDGRVDGRDLALLEKAYHFTAPSQTPPTSGTNAGDTSATPAGTGATPAAPGSGTSDGTSNGTSNGNVNGNPPSSGGTTP